MRSTKFWVVSTCIFFLLSAAASFFVQHRTADGSVVNIYQNGICIHSFDLTNVGEGYTFDVAGAVTNTIAVEQGRVCIVEATCPDRFCVRQGWITNSVIPIVCLPNALVIQMEGSSKADGIDAISR